MSEERLGASFSIDTTALKSGLAQANRLIRESESEFKAAAAGMDDWTTSQEGLEARIKHLNNAQDLQRKKVEALKKQYEEAGYSVDDMSTAAVTLRTNINREQAALNKTERELRQQEQALQELGQQSDETSEATSKFSKALGGIGKVGKAVVGAIVGIAVACVGAVTGFLSLAESTRETRTALAKVDQSFKTAGLSAENASKTMSDLYGVLGDTDKTTEAANLIAKMSKDEADLEANTRILSGVFAEFGDSIPTEGLAEGMQATAQMGVVQGVLADALEWQGINLDEYNEKLATMTSEEERAAYIQETLTGLYGESADAYRENNKALIEANKAQLELDKSLAELGAIAEPIMTTLKQLSSELLQSLMPFVKLIGEGLTGALNGTSEAADKLADGLSGIISSLLDKIVEMLPFAIETVVAIVPKLISTLVEQLPMILQTVINGVTQIITAIGEMLPTLIPIIIDAILMIVETLLDNINLIVDAGISLIMGLADGLINAIPLLLEKIPVIIEKLIQALLTNIPKLQTAGIKLIISLATGLIKAIPQLLKSIPQIIASIINGFANSIPEISEIGSDLIRGLWQGIQDMGKWINEKIKGFGEGIMTGLKKFFGIASPSKLLENEVGKNLALGIGEGFEKNIGNVNEEIQKSMEFEGANINVNANGKQKGVDTGKTVNIYQTNNYSQAHSRLELYKNKQATANAVKLALGGAL